MSLQLKEMGTPRPKMERLAEGAYMSRIASVVDLGTQPQTDWQTGEETDSKKRVLITWELPTERITLTNEDGEDQDLPRWISKEYTLSNFDQSNLMKLIKAITKSPVESVADLLNTPCMINVGSTSGGNAKVTSAMRVPTGMDVAPLENEATYFDFDDPNKDLFLKQVKWVQEKIKSAENYNGFADNWE